MVTWPPYQKICIFCHEIIDGAIKHEIVECPHCGRTTVVAEAQEVLQAKQGVRS